jgi:hypothetical protein
MKSPMRFCAFECLRVTRFLVPHQEREDDVVVAPQVPLAEQALVLAEGPEVAFLILPGDDLGDGVFHRRAEFFRIRHAQRLDSADKVFPGELARPWHQLRHGPAVADLKHLDHARVCGGRRDQPVLDICLYPFAKDAAELEARASRRRGEERTARRICPRRFAKNHGGHYGQKRGGFSCSVILYHFSSLEARIAPIFTRTRGNSDLITPQIASSSTLS